jgi:hypothetical protein
MFSDDIFIYINSGVKAPLGGKCHVKNRKYSSLDLEIDPSRAQKQFLFNSFS